MVVFSAGMVVFFLLAAILTRTLGEGRRAELFMLLMAGVFTILLVLTVSAGT